MTKEELGGRVGAGELEGVGTVVVRTNLDGVAGKGEDISTKTQKGRRSRLQSIGKEVVCQVEQLVLFGSITLLVQGSCLNNESPRSQLQ